MLSKETIQAEIDYFNANGFEVIIKPFQNLCDALNIAKAGEPENDGEAFRRTLINEFLGNGMFRIDVFRSIAEGNSMRRYHVNPLYLSEAQSAIQNHDSGALADILRNNYRTSVRPIEKLTNTRTPEESGLADLLNIKPRLSNEERQKYIDSLDPNMQNVASAWTKLIDAVEAERERKFTADIVPLAQPVK